MLTKNPKKSENLNFTYIFTSNIVKVNFKNIFCRNFLKMLDILFQKKFFFKNFSRVIFRAPK